MANPNTADIRPYLTSAYSDEKITVLCTDYFRDVSDNFAAGMNKGQKIQLLLDHCRRRDAIPNLLAALEKDRSEQYRKRFGPVVVEVGPAPARRKRDPRQVFISHAHEDAEFAHRLAADLQTHGWRTWLAPDSIRPGEKWVEAINRGLEESGVFAVALTPAALRSRWVTMETNIAIEQEVSGEICFIPLGVQPCKPPALWNAYQRVPFDGRYGDGVRELLHRLNPAPPAVLTIESPSHLDLVRVPVGKFLMGSDPTKDKDADDDEKPQHRLYLPDFYIGKYPVTVAQFNVFVKATGHQTAAELQGHGWVWMGAKWEKVSGADWRHPRGPQTSVDQKADHPVVHVAWRDVVAFCQWLSQVSGRMFRLPTEAEWEKASRGDDGRIFPWGDQSPDRTRCNFNMHVGDTTPVGQYSQGASPYGALDMAGNVWEWTGSLWGKSAERPDFAYPYDPQDGREDLSAPGTMLRVLRGGAFRRRAKLVRCAMRNWHGPSLCYGDLGFRVAASPLHS